MEAGLKHVDLLAPSRGYLETLASLERQNQELTGRLSSELGWHLSDSQTLFARGWADTSGDLGIGAGWRWTW